MRDDMDEVIIERPRRGSRWIKHERRTRRIDAKVTVARDPEVIPLQIGLGRWAAISRNSKSLNENLAPLRRYLEKQVGRPWDKVWSDVSKNLSAASTVQQHVRDHIGDFVATRTFIRNGTVYATGRSGGPRTLVDCPHRLYVDPRSGILRQNKHYRDWQQEQRASVAAAARERATRMREISPDTQVHEFENRGWWEVKLAPKPRVAASGGGYYATGYEFVSDVVLGVGWSSLPAEKLYGQAGVYAVSKRQLSRKEITALDLRAKTPVPQRSRS
ncbi:MAG: hypothetical protein E6G97_07015 [Alphaproteobacteria bacterium]|nr:MAG: hypothetical protein E6G97_07015 [Alphaproteobacteria bacterium]